MLATILTVLASLVGVFAFIKYVVIVEMRIDANSFKILYDLYKQHKKIVVTEEFTCESRYPQIFTAFCFFNSAYFFINHTERLLQAGWQNKEHVTTIICLRWHYGKVRTFLKNNYKNSFSTLGVPVSLLLPWSMDKIGSLKNQFPAPLIDKNLWQDFEQEVAEVADGKRLKTGALLYGPPGNGKTSLVKYLATKYRLPIMIVTFSPDWTNHDLMLLFSQIPPKCIVLLEDFDNYFHGRTCIMSGGDQKMVKFTFDIILNALDGVYTTYENVVFIMTVNQIDKVDYALKNRPSRFKYTKLFNNPSLEIRNQILNTEWANASEGLNLDQVLRLNDFQKNGDTLETALSKIYKEANGQFGISGISYNSVYCINRSFNLGC